MTDSIGAFVFTVTRDFVPCFPEEIFGLAEQHGFEKSIVPEYAGDRAAFSRAVQETRSGLWREDLLLRPIKRTSSEMVFGIVREYRDETAQQLSHETESTVIWKSYPDPSIIEGTHPVAIRVAEAYENLRGKIVSDDWTDTLTKFFEEQDAARVREDGRVYWLPPQALETVSRLKTFLESIGISLVVLPSSAEPGVVQHIIQKDLHTKLEQLQREARNFDGRQKPSTYKRRLEKLRRLRQRAQKYNDATEVNTGNIVEAISDLEVKLSDLLKNRKQTVYRRDGTIEKHVIIQPDAKEEDDAPTPDRVGQEELFK